MHRTVPAVLAGLLLGFVLLVVALAAARRGNLGWDVAGLAVYAPVALALVFGALASWPSSSGSGRSGR